MVAVDSLVHWCEDRVGGGRRSVGLCRTVPTPSGVRLSVPWWMGQAQRG